MTVLHAYAESRAILGSILTYRALKYRSVKTVCGLCGLTFLPSCVITISFFLFFVKMPGLNCAIRGCNLSKKLKLALEAQNRVEDLASISKTLVYYSARSYLYIILGRETSILQNQLALLYMCCFALFLYIRELQEKLHSSLKASLKYILLIFVYFKMYLFFILQLTKSRLMPGLPALNLPEKCIMKNIFYKYMLLYLIFFKLLL